MKLFTKNITWLGRVTVFLFLVASSGFTTMLHLCTMDASECCDTSGASHHNACADPEESSPVAGPSVQNVGGCHTNAVVGGLSVIQTLLEKDGKPKDVHTLTLLISPIVTVVPSTTTPLFSYSYLESVSPPSVEKYVLNDTFLI